MLTLSLDVPNWAAKIPAGRKLAVLFLASLLMFPLSNPYVLLTCLLGVICLYLSVGRVMIVAGLGMARPIVWICGIILAYHLFIEELLIGLAIILKILAMVGLANFVTMTTRLSDMKEVILHMLRPFERFGMNTNTIALAFTLVMRFTPVLLLKGSALTESWRARSTTRAGWRVVIPLILLALDDAENVAEALRARGGMGKNGDTPWKEI